MSQKPPPADAPAWDRQLRWLPLLSLGAATGLFVGALGAAFRIALEALDAGRTAWLESIASRPVLGWVGPMVGVGLALWLAAEAVRRFAPEAAGSGIQEIEGTLSGRRPPLRWQRVLPVKFLGGLLGLGSGAVLGREGPTVQMGGAVGALLGDGVRLGSEERRVLVAAGAGAGLSAAFNAPFAGILFVLEEMRPHFPYRVVSVEAVLVAVAVSDLVVRATTGDAPVIAMPAFPPAPEQASWLFPIFGLLFGLFGVAFNRLLLATLDGLDRLPGWARRLAPLAIGAGIGALAVAWPDAVGGGYRAIADAVAGRIAGAALLGLFLVRYVATLVSYGSGAPGGIFAPMLALGTLFGMFFGATVQAWSPELVPHTGVFALAGMAAFFAATVRAPLTGIVLAAELTGDFDQLLSLILTCCGAIVAAQALGGRPIYEQLLERRLRRDAAAEGSGRAPRAAREPA